MKTLNLNLRAFVLRILSAVIGVSLLGYVAITYKQYLDTRVEVFRRESLEKKNKDLLE